MAEHPDPTGTTGFSAAWHGHTLRPLPSGDSWFSGGQRQPRIVAQPPSPHDALDALDALLEDLWSFEEFRAASSAAVAAPASAGPANARRTGALLLVVILTAIATIFFAHRTGGSSEPAPLPAPPSHVITAVSRTQPTAASIRVGDYLDFQLPGGRTYSTVLEQPTSQTPVVEAIALPGQQPQLRGDSAGRAVIEVMSAPLCTNPDGCPDQRTLLGTVDLTVTP
jgi:hypothetical protein